MTLSTKVQTVISIILFVILCLETDKTSMFECFTSMNSKCPNNKVTHWNKNDVGKHLKEWIMSVSVRYLSNSSVTTGNY